MKAKCGDSIMTAKLTMGPILFHWEADKKRDFYFKIADESPVDTVYIGEVICSKRAPFFEAYYDEVADRLVRAGKTVVFSSLAEIMTLRERKMTKEICELDSFEIEANDSAALYHLRGKPHRVGQYFNTYNEETMAYMVSKGATHFSLLSELPAESIAILGEKAKKLKVGLEVQVYGRTGLALSARCYHARSHDRVKNNCKFICKNDPDGLDIKTLSGKPFLSINGIQTLSYSCLNLIQEIQEMISIGVTHFRLSPHNHDMIEISKIFYSVINKEKNYKEALEQLNKTRFSNIFSNGFYHKKAGYLWIKKN